MITLLLSFPLVLAQDTDTDMSADAWSELRARLDASCIECHAGEHPDGGLDLTASLEAWRRDDPDVLRLIAERVEECEMPPAKASRPLLDADRARMLVHLAAVLGPAVPPRASTLRRLTRFELERSVEHVFGVRYDAQRTFPRDAAGHGFDNLGDVMFVSDALVEKYFDAAREICDAVYADELASARVSGEPRDVLERLLLHAFRRPPTGAEVEQRLALWSSEDGLRPALLSILLSPHFLFRVERDHGADTPQPLDAFELATRLAFLIWSHGPDAELLALAASGELNEADVLRGQVTRMLDDERSRALADGFAAQWLGFRGILDEAVDIRTYRGFTAHLKRAMYEESALWFAFLYRADQPLTRLVDADWTIADPLLAHHYGGGGRSPADPFAFADGVRGGILTHASILTLTSHPDRTSPVLRGAWILDTLLADPSPPPPPDAGELPPEGDADRGKASGPTVRERLERHRAESRCASCHARIDPLGFALEAFDGVGRLRETEKDRPVDTRGVLPDGTLVDGVAALKRYLSERPRDLARAFVERLFVYGVGRPAEAWDEPAIEAVLDASAREAWRTRALIEGFVASAPFRERGPSR